MFFFHLSLNKGTLFEHLSGKMAHQIKIMSRKTHFLSTIAFANFKRCSFMRGLEFEILFSGGLQICNISEKYSCLFGKLDQDTIIDFQFSIIHAKELLPAWENKQNLIDIRLKPASDSEVVAKQNAQKSIICFGKLKALICW